MFDLKHIKLGIEEWKRLSSELGRIGGSDKLELLVSMVLIPSEGGEEEEGEEEEEQHEHASISIEELNDIVNSLKSNMGVDAHYHSHGDHGELFISATMPGSKIPGAIRDIINEVKACESCRIHSIDGEVHLDEDVSAIMFGDSYKLTFILPNQDGRRLIIMELHV